MSITSEIKKAVRHAVMCCLLVAFFLPLVNTAHAQNFPPASACTSKDLDMLDLLLQSNQMGMDYQSGRRKMKLTITNSTGVDRKSFVLWGNLKRFDSYGKLKSSEPVFLCVDSVKKQSTVTLAAKDSLYYNEDETLLITNIYTAWSSASVNENCDVLSQDASKIAPRCAVKDSFRVYTGVNARFNPMRANCSNGKGRLRAAPFGGKGPYRVAISDENGVAKDTFTVNDRDSLSWDLEPGIYKISITDARKNASVFRRTVDAPFPLDKPKFSVTHPDCVAPRGLVKLLNKDNTAAYQLNQNGVLAKYNLNNDQFEEVESGNYTIVAQKGVCRNSDSVLVNGRPLIPGKPTSKVTHPDCKQAKGFVNIEHIQNEVIYHLTQNGQQKFSNANGIFSEIPEGTYIVQAAGPRCNTWDTIVINPKPEWPAKPQFNVNHPDCVMPKGLVKLMNRRANATYQLLQDSVVKYTANDSSFDEVEDGTYTLLATIGKCSNADNVVVNRRPLIPGKPTSKVTHPDCKQAKGFVNIEHIQNEVIYHLTQNGQQKFSNANGIFSEIPEGTYIVQAAGPRCNTWDTIVINPKPEWPDKPQFNVNHPDCVMPKGLVKLMNRRANATYQLLQDSVVKYTANDSSFDEVEDGTYTLLATIGKCSNADNVVVNRRPLIPGKPTSKVTHPDCKQAKGFVNIDHIQNEVIYHLTQNGQQKFSNANGIFSEIPEGTYIVQAAGPRCNTWDTIVINPKPEWPDKPQFNVNHPDCVMPKGLVKLMNRRANATYQLLQDSVVKYTANDSSFDEVEDGTYTLLATIGKCSNADNVVVNRRPLIPGKPTSKVTHPDCKQAKGFVNIDHIQNEVIYHLTQNGQQKFSNANGIFSEIPEGTYIVQAAGPRCNTWDTIVINPKPEWPAKPQANIRHPNCDFPRGLLQVSNHNPRSSYVLLQGETVKYTSADSIFDGVDAGTYTLKSAIGLCENAADVVIDQRPLIPNKPKSKVKDPDCKEAKGFVNIEHIQNEVIYHLTQNGVQKFTSANGIFSEVPEGSYIVKAAGPVCNTFDTIVINPKPEWPAKPLFAVRDPNCEEAKGLVWVTNRNIRSVYELLRDSAVLYTATDTTFSNVETGTYILRSTIGTCTNTNDLVVKQRPLIPNKPVADVIHPNCVAANGSVKVRTIQQQVGYYLTQGGTQKFSSDSGSFSEVPEGSYIVKAAGPVCTTFDTIIVNPKPEWPVKPIFSLRDPDCDKATGRLAVSNYKSYATYQLLQGMTVKYTAADSVFSAVEAGTYEIVVTIGNCKNKDGVVVNPQPFVPSVPAGTVLHPTCINDKGQVTVTNKQTNVQYTLVKELAVMYTANGDGIFGSVSAGTYTLAAQSTISVCRLTSSTTVNDQPPTPQSPVLTLQAPDFCSDKGSVTIASPSGEGLLYSKDGGSNWQVSNTFGNLAAGHGADWNFKVKNSFGCISSSGMICLASGAAIGGEITTSSNGALASRVSGEQDAESVTGNGTASEERVSKYLGTAQLTDPTVTLKAIPNPFGAHVRFQINNPIAGKGILEIFDTQGHLIKRVFEGFVYEGPNYFDLSMPVNNRTEMIYILRIGDKRISGKLLRIGSNRY